MLMGLCQTEDLEGLVLVYERVHCGSLYTFLHQKVSSLNLLTLVFAVNPHINVIMLISVLSFSHRCMYSQY